MQQSFKKNETMADAIKRLNRRSNKTEHCELCDKTISQTSSQQNGHCQICDDTLTVSEEEQSAMLIEIISNLEKRIDQLENK